jgi:arabinosyltransferase C
MPAIVSSAATGVTVAILLFSFVVAPFRQAGSYSLGQQMFTSIVGGSCGIIDHVVATPDLPGGVLTSSHGGDESVGFRRNMGYAPGNQPPASAGTGSAEHLWGSLDGGQISTGSLTSGWFGLPRLPDSQELAVSVAGRSGDGNRLALEFGQSTASGVRPLGERVLDDTHTDPDERPIYPTDHVIEDEPQDHPSWRTLYVPAREVPAGADQVRVRAVDSTTDPAGWLAVTGPRIREVIPLREYMRGKAPVLVDWSMTWSAPCLRDMPRVGGGLVEPPAFLLNPPDDLGFGGVAAYTRGIGGSFAGVPEVGTQDEIPTRLLGVEDKPEYAEWGHLVAVNYPAKGNGYDVHSVPVARWGWTGEE